MFHLNSTGLIADVAAQMLQLSEQTPSGDEGERTWREELHENKAAVTFRVFTAEGMLATD